MQGSFSGPVAYFRNGSGNPLVSYADLSARWGVSKATVGRVLKKLSRLGHITLVTFPGRHGTAIYLQNYLSTMFQISDVMVDKAEVALSLNIKIPQLCACQDAEEGTSCVSTQPIIVSKPPMDFMVQKVLQLLEWQGVPCSQCPRCSYKLYPLSADGKGEYLEDGRERPLRFRLEVFCGSGEPRYVFLLSTSIEQKEVNQNG